MNEWVGPYTIVAGDSKNVWLNVDGKMKLASVDKVEEYRSAYEENGRHKTASYVRSRPKQSSR